MYIHKNILLLLQLLLLYLQAFYISFLDLGHHQQHLSIDIASTSTGVITISIGSSAIGIIDSHGIQQVTNLSPSPTLILRVLGCKLLCNACQVLVRVLHQLIKRYLVLKCL